ncbi:MAG: hypothetical protein ACYCW6_00265 [Candidatus Xenobia bacterium]
MKGQIEARLVAGWKPGAVVEWMSLLGRALSAQTIGRHYTACMGASALPGRPPVLQQVPVNVELLAEAIDEQDDRPKCPSCGERLMVEDYDSWTFMYSWRRVRQSRCTCGLTAKMVLGIHYTDPRREWTI